MLKKFVIFLPMIFYSLVKSWYFIQPNNKNLSKMARESLFPSKYTTTTNNPTLTIVSYSNKTEENLLESVNPHVITYDFNYNEIINYIAILIIIIVILLLLYFLLCLIFKLKRKIKNFRRRMNEYI